PRSLLRKTGGVGDLFPHHTKRFQSAIFDTQELAPGFFIFKNSLTIRCERCIVLSKAMPFIGKNAGQPDGGQPRTSKSSKKER
ncbi:MAG: hypothetical protein LBG43_11030, partial [Treponema sp.]|nr:hypothetical protein [Treponema sp.]